jgi:hypothetical protein
MFIQYVDFTLSEGTRSYTFDVIDTAGKPREFTVIVPVVAFRQSGLKAQDGPGICYARVVRELERETGDSRAETLLQIKEQDIQEYMAKQYPRKYSNKRASATNS